MVIDTKFNVNDTVYMVGVNPEDKHIKCPICENNEDFVADCSECCGDGFILNLHPTYSTIKEEVREIRIEVKTVRLGGKDMTVRIIGYILKSDRINNRIVPTLESALYSSQIEAQIECDRLNKLYKEEA